MRGRYVNTSSKSIALGTKLAVAALVLICCIYIYMYGARDADTVKEF